MQTLAKAFLTSVKAQMSPDAFSLSTYMTEKTYIDGKKFSFRGHEFQAYCTSLVENNPGCTFVVSKPSQIGMSEWVYRIILSKLGVLPGNAAILSMPSITFANEVFKTRIASIIRESPELKAMLDTNNDSASVKAFHNNSIVYALGGSEQSKSSLLNRKVGIIVVDEVDRQTRDVYTGYRSRQTHVLPEDRCNILISTPTISDYGIDREIKECGITHEPLVKCHNCYHEFLPDYYDDIIVPGYSESLLLLTKGNISGLRIDDAYLRCPNCRGKADEGLDREIVWEVTENPDWPATSIGVKLNPWVAFSFISIPDLIRASVQYSSTTEWLNQGLGKVTSAASSSLSKKKFIFDNQPVPHGSHIFGLDMGKLCAWMHGVVLPDTSIRVIDTEIVKLPDLEAFLDEKTKEFTFSAAVMDQQPYADLMYKFVRKYSRLYSCIYLDPIVPIPELYKLKLTDKHNQLVRQVGLNKTLAFDSFFGMLEDFISFQISPLDSTVLLHFLSLRRVRDYNRGDDIRYKWVKTSREDHFAHAFIYMVLASKLAYAGINTASASIPIVINKINPDRLRQANKRR